jgi:hypothetical protein
MNDSYHWSDDYQQHPDSEFQDFIAEQEEQERLELKILRGKVQQAKERYLLSERRGLKDAQLRKMDWINLIDKLEWQQRIVDLQKN